MVSNLQFAYNFEKMLNDQILSFGINFNTHSFMVKKQRRWKIFFDKSSVAKFIILEKKWQINLNIKFQSKNLLKELPKELDLI